MNLQTKTIAINFLLSGLAIFVAWRLAILVSERFFFDRLYYKKSEVYGYHPRKYNLLNYRNNTVLEDRIRDLRELVNRTSSLENQDNVLGAEVDPRFKVVVLGDSFVFGLGVKQSERFPEILQQELNRYRPTKIFVLAQADDGMLENYAKLEMAKQLKPDVVIFTILHNDFLIDSTSKYPGENALYTGLKANCKLPEFRYTWPKKKIAIPQLINEAFYPSVQPQYANLCYFDQIVKELVKEKTLFFSLHQEAYRYREAADEASQKNAYIIEQYSRIVQNHGGQIIYFDESKYTPVSQRESHPSAKVHALYAEQLVKEITTNPKYRFFP